MTRNPRNSRNPRLTPLARPMVDDLARQIDSGRLAPGDKLPTLRDLAAGYGVSYRIALTAVAHLEQTQLVESIQGSGTYVRRRAARPGAAANAGSQVFIFCNEVPETYAALIQPIALHLQQAGLFVTPLDYGVNASRLAELQPVFQSWAANPPRAIVLKGHYAPVVETIRRFVPPGTCLIAAYTTRAGNSSDWHIITPDEQAAYTLAARSLLERGHKRLGLLAMRRRPEPSQDDRHFADRHIKGILTAFADAGRPRSLTLHMVRSGSDDPWGLGLDDANVRRVARWLTRKDRPTGVLVAGHRAGCAKLAAKAAGLRIGQDFDLVAYGDPRPALEGEFDCVTEQPPLIAEHILRLILDHQADAPGTVKHIAIPPRYVCCQPTPPSAPPRSVRRRRADRIHA